jgi:hypothetical protein
MDAPLKVWPVVALALTEFAAPASSGSIARRINQRSKGVMGHYLQPVLDVLHSLQARGIVEATSQEEDARRTYFWALTPVGRVIAEELRTLLLELADRRDPT